MPRLGRLLLVFCLAALISGCSSWSSHRDTVYLDGTYGHSYGVSHWRAPASRWGYYPWWSMDWFYLGYGYRDPYVAWSAYRRYGFPYASLHYPWYGWAPTYAWAYPWYPWAYEPWCPPGWRYPDLRHRTVHPVTGSEFVAVTRPGGPDFLSTPMPRPVDRRAALGDDWPREFEERWMDRRTGVAASPFERRIVAPGFPDSERGGTMVVRSRGSDKLSPSRTEPLPPWSGLYDTRPSTQETPPLGAYRGAQDHRLSPASKRFDAPARPPAGSAPGVSRPAPVTRPSAPVMRTAPVTRPSRPARARSAPRPVPRSAPTPRVNPNQGER